MDQVRKLDTATASSTIITPVVATTTQDDPGLGAGGTCARKSAATRVRRIISPGLGRAMDQMPVGHQSGPSSSGVTTLGRSWAKRTVSGSCRAATTVTLYGHGHVHWSVRSLLDKLTQLSRLFNAAERIYSLSGVVEFASILFIWQSHGVAPMGSSYFMTIVILSETTGGLNG
jgi:hypothetical protein